MIGHTISHYRILEKLGEGGMGVVYKAQDTKLDRLVALKFLPHHLTEHEAEQARFLQEAKAASALNHPNVCGIHSIGEHEGQNFIDMEYVEGKTLRKMLAAGSLKINDAVEYAIQIGDALQEAHAKGIVHRDIKCENLMVNTRNQIKVMDFGLAKLKGSLKLTKTSSTVGTLAYMAPEQIQGGEVDSRSDIFSFGVAFFEMLSGHMPFRGEHDAAMMYSILNEDPDPLTKYIPDVSPELLHIIGRALEKAPEDRYQSVSDMVIDLRRAKKDSSRVSRAPLSGMSAVQPQPTNGHSGETAKIPSEKKRFLGLVGLALIILALGFMAYLQFSGEGETGEKLPVAVADFVNNTKEPELDGLSGMLITSLEQSRRLAVLTRSRMFDILKQMGKDDIDRIDEAVGKEICAHASVNALVTASIRKFGKLYTIDLKVLDPTKNEYLFTAKEEGEGQESIPSMLDKLSEKTRIGLKEKAAEVQAAKGNVAELTTSNLDAYQHYFQGEQLSNKLEFDEAAEEYRKAVAIDTSFALAYYRLAYSLSWPGKPGADEAMMHAMRHRDRVPEKARYLIRGENAIIQRDVHGALAIFKELLSQYPDEKEALYLVGDYSYHLGDYPTAVADLEKVLTLDPKFERAYHHLSWTYGAMERYKDKLDITRKYVAQIQDVQSFDHLGESYINIAQFDSARQTYTRASELFPKSRLPHIGIGRSELFLNNFTQAEAEFRKLLQTTASADDHHAGYMGLMELDLYRGKYHEAMKTANKAIEIARSNDLNLQTAITFFRKSFLLSSGFNDREKGRRAIDEGLRVRCDEDIVYHSTLFYAYLSTGEFQKAEQVGTAHLKIVSPSHEHVLNAYRRLESKEYSEALREFHKLSSDRDPLTRFDIARCYAESGQLDKAREYLNTIEKRYKTDEVDSRSIAVPRAFHLLGQLYEKQGDNQRAKQSYEKVLLFWKDADNDIPELQNAKTRLATLNKLTKK